MKTRIGSRNRHGIQFDSTWNSTEKKAYDSEEREREGSVNLDYLELLERESSQMEAREEATTIDEAAGRRDCVSFDSENPQTFSELRSKEERTNPRRPKRELLEDQKGKTRKSEKQITKVK